MTIRRIMCRALGPPENLLMESAAPPVAGPGQLRVAVHASSCNRNELLRLRGGHHVQPPLPYTPGSDVAGSVLEVAGDVGAFAIGDRVLGVMPNASGAWAEEVVLDCGWAVKLPDWIAFDEAATYPSAYITAYDALVHAGAVSHTDTVLVTGAGGGVGLAAVQIAAHLGANIIAVAGSEERLEAARLAGAQHCIDRRGGKLRDAVHAVTDGRGADVAIEVIGGAMLRDAMRCMAWRGRLVIAGFASWDIPEIRAIQILLKAIDLRGANLLQTLQNCPGRFGAMADQLFRWQSEGAVRPRVARRFALDEAASAVHFAAAGEHVGKVVIDVLRKV